METNLCSSGGDTQAARSRPCTGFPGLNKNRFKYRTIVLWAIKTTDVQIRAVLLSTTEEYVFKREQPYWDHVFILLCVLLVFNSAHVIFFPYRQQIKLQPVIYLQPLRRGKCVHKTTNYFRQQTRWKHSYWHVSRLLRSICVSSAAIVRQMKWLDNWPHLPERRRRLSPSPAGSNTAGRLRHRKPTLPFNMPEAKSSPLLLFVCTLLMVSCQSPDHAAEQGTYSIICLRGSLKLVCWPKSTSWGVCFSAGATGDEHAANINVETSDFTFNSTNMTNFAYGIAANVVAVLLYGSNFVPVKRIETGDVKYTALFFPK